MRPRLLAAALLAPVAVHAAPPAAPVAPAPVWVEAVPLPSPSAPAARLRGGLEWLLVDTQARIDPDRRVTWVRKAYRVAARAGLEGGAAFGVEYAPTLERVVLHHARLTRAGATRDLLPLLETDLLRREPELERGVLSGRLLLHARIPDVRVGDVIDHAFSFVGDAPDLPPFAVRFDLAGADPIGLVNLRLDAPPDAPLTARLLNAPGALQERMENGRRVIAWQRRNAPAFTAEEQLPPDIDPQPRLEASAVPDWAAVARWAEPLFRAPPLPPAFAAEVDAIAAATPDPAERAVRALRLVQDGIRYTSLALGAGAWRPRDPATVVASGYGDCKDKSVLLAAALTRLGLDAAPALVNSARGPALPGALPSPMAFDHAVVALRLDGRTWWLDPTLTDQGGTLATMSPLPFAWALPLRPGQASLEPIAAPPPSAPRVDVTEHLAPAAGGALRLTVTTRWTGDAADGMRRQFAMRGVEEVATDFLRLYGSLHPGVAASRPLELRDDRDANLLIVTEHYALPPTSSPRRAFAVQAMGVRDVFAEPPAGERASPLALRSPGSWGHRLVLDGFARPPAVPADADVRGPGFTLSRAASRDGGRTVIEWRLDGVADRVAADALAAHRAALQAADALTQPVIALDAP